MPDTGGMRRPGKPFDNDWRYGLLLRIAIAVTVIAAVWLPHFSHYQIDRDLTPVQMVNASTQKPAQAVLDELSSMRFGIDLEVPNEKIVQTAEQIVGGHLAVPRFLDSPLALQGYPRDYQTGPSTLQLVMASLAPERILLTAFEQSGDRRFLDLALARILAFAAHEVDQTQSDGFLWNDHAVSARISVLIALWRHVRAIPGLPDTSLREIVSLVERSGRLLAKPGNFTVRTNHGVVQNLALLQITAAFPAMAESESWRTLAVERLQLQLQFYVSSEGVVLEHSAEYHSFGTELLAQAVRLCVLNGLLPDPILARDAQNARTVLERMIRPDGTLPVLGNTSAGVHGSIPIVERDGAAPIRHVFPPFARPTTGVSVFPAAGYAIWWQEDSQKVPSQTVVAWAKHDGHGHKHADEGSVLFWSNGVDWITNTGYWPYDAPNSAGAYSWTGSNALHQLGEAFDVRRLTQVLATADAVDFRFIDVVRRNEDGPSFRRQILQLDAQTLLVVDFARGAPKGTETIWTVDTALRLAPTMSGDAFTSTPAADGRYLTAAYSVSTGAAWRIRRGSPQPFGGWVVVNNKPTPADALQLVDPSTNSANAILFKVASSSSESRGTIHLESGATEDHWTILIKGFGDSKRLTRSDHTLSIDSIGRSGSLGSTMAINLLPLPVIDTERASLKKAYLLAVETYPPWRDLSFYRLRITYLIGVLALLVETVWFAVSHAISITTMRQFILVHVGFVVLWLVTSIWILGLYLRVAVPGVM